MKYRAQQLSYGLTHIERRDVIAKAEVMTLRPAAAAAADHWTSLNCCISAARFIAVQVRRQRMPVLRYWLLT